MIRFWPGTVTLVIGGARSGKSAFAERLAADERGPVWYVATAQIHDDEMAARVSAHQARRPADWHTVEATREIGEALKQLAAATGAQPATVLLDDLGLLTSNLLLALVGGSDPTPETTRQLDGIVAAEIDALLVSQAAGGWSLIVVSQEVGGGVVPPTPLGRVFRDALGRGNQRLAAAADSAFLVTAGLPLRLKPPCEHLGLPPGVTIK